MPLARVRCRLTPVARFDAIEQRLTATQQAIELIRTPLARLYDFLGDAQKAKFDAVALGRQRRPGKTKEQQPNDVAAACKERSQQFTGLPAQQIADLLKPTQDQKPAFDALKAAAQEASATVAAACPNTVPENITERFDAIDARLKATIAAIKTVEPEVEGVLCDAHRRTEGAIQSSVAAGNFSARGHSPRLVGQHSGISGKRVAQNPARRRGAGLACCIIRGVPRLHEAERRHAVRRCCHAPARSQPGSGLAMRQTASEKFFRLRCNSDFCRTRPVQRRSDRIAAYQIQPRLMP